MTLTENYAKALLAMTDNNNYDLTAHFHYEQRLIDLYFGNDYAKQMYDNAYLQTIEEGCQLAEDILEFFEEEDLVFFLSSKLESALIGHAPAAWRRPLHWVRTRAPPS